MKRSGDSTHICRSPTSAVNAHDLTLSTWKQTSEQEYSDLTTSNKRQWAPYSHNTPRSYSQGTWSYALSRSPKHGDFFGILPRFLKNLLESKSLICHAIAHGRNKNRTWYHSGLVQLFCDIFFKALGKPSVNYSKFPKKHCRLQKSPWCLRPLP